MRMRSHGNCRISAVRQRRLFATMLPRLVWVSREDVGAGTIRGERRPNVYYRVAVREPDRRSVRMPGVPSENCEHVSSRGGPRSGVDGRDGSGAKDIQRSYATRTAARSANSASTIIIFRTCPASIFAVITIDTSDIIVDATCAATVTSTIVVVVVDGSVCRYLQCMSCRRRFRNLRRRHHHCRDSCC